jgi:hypothetical protein
MNYSVRKPQEIIYIDLQPLQKLGLVFSQTNNVLKIISNDLGNQQDKLDYKKENFTTNPLVNSENLESNIHQNYQSTSKKTKQYLPINQVECQEKVEQYHQKTNNLYDWLKKHFHNPSMVRELCLYLQIDYEKLTGENTYIHKTMELAYHLILRQKIPCLLSHLSNNDKELLNLLIEEANKFYKNHLDDVLDNPDKYPN